MKVTHVITGLQTGGAESLLARVAPRQVADGLAVHVICLGPPGPLSEKLTNQGIQVSHLHASGLLSLPLTLRKLRRCLAQSRPDVVHTWLYHADLLGGLAARSLAIPVIWALHHAGVGRGDLKRGTYWVVRLLAKLSSRLPTAILSCSQVGLESHRAIGYDARKLHFLPNGTDTAAFQPARGSNTAPGNRVATIGLAARFHPLKDYPNFFSAIRHFQKNPPTLRNFDEVHFVACGQGVCVENQACRDQLATLPNPEKVQLLGPQSDLASFYASLTLFTLSSRSEAFPLTLGEAMSCGIPCVATDVGDVKFLLGDTGLTCLPQAPEALAEAWKTMLQHPLSGARQRILEHFSMDKMLLNLHTFYQTAHHNQNAAAAP